MLIASLLALVATLGYAALCMAQPFSDCRKCSDLGHKMRLDRKGRPKLGKVCRRCRGRGKRLRLGRRAHNAWRRTHASGNRPTPLSQKES